MNYYERHLGDYAKDTAHLSMLEHGAYSLLLDRYYATEEPIQASQVYRLARARSREEKAAVDAVLEEFFEPSGDEWVHRRCDQEIAKFRASEPDREAKRENERERQRRTRERRKELFERLREFGVVPEYDAPMSVLQAEIKRVTSQHVTPPVTRDATATQPQTPDTSNTEEEKYTHCSTSPEPVRVSAPSEPAPTSAGLLCRAMKAAGIADPNPGHPDMLALIAAGATEAEFVGAARSAVSKGKGFAYAIGTLKRQRIEASQAASAMHHGPMPAPAAGGPTTPPLSFGEIEAKRLAERYSEATGGLCGDQRAMNPRTPLPFERGHVPAAHDVIEGEAHEQRRITL